MKAWYRKLKAIWDRDVRPLVEPALRIFVTKKVAKEVDRWKK